MSKKKRDRVNTREFDTPLSVSYLQETALLVGRAQGLLMAVLMGKDRAEAQDIDLLLEASARLYSLAAVVTGCASDVAALLKPAHN